MKLKLLPALLLASQLHAATIDLPQGSQIWQVKHYAQELQFFDQFEDGAWISLYGILNGGTLFNTDLNTLSWNFGDSDYHILYAVINDGQDSVKVVGMTRLDMFQGDLTLTAFNNAPVQRLDIYGRFGLSERASTLTLLVIALIVLVSFYDKKATR